MGDLSSDMLFAELLLGEMKHLEVRKCAVCVQVLGAGGMGAVGG